MAFSSRRGGWPNSLLPSTNKHCSSKQPRKSRRRTAVKDFFLTNFFTIVLSLSLLLFILVVFRYGIPKPLISSHLRAARNRFSTRSRKPVYRKSSTSQDLSGAIVDLTTKDFYDKIQFLDEDGGPWKQGWKVQYKGNEWDNEKLKIFVVPHSHNDPGWKLTVDEYYNKQSRHILDTIVDTLSKDVRRKFIWEEMSYLEKWWRDSSNTKKESFVNLVHNGQLEIVGGGWVMNDEDISVDNVSDMFELSEAFNAISLRNSCILFILENFDRLRVMPWYSHLIQRILSEMRKYFATALTRPTQAELRT